VSGTSRRAVRRRRGFTQRREDAIIKLLDGESFPTCLPVRLAGEVLFDEGEHFKPDPIPTVAGLDKGL